MPLPDLPPAYNLVVLDRELGAFERAVSTAPRGLDDGTLYWTERTDRLDAAIVLEPEAPAAATVEALYVLTVATGDALSTLVPPEKPVAFAWPAHILLDGTDLGRVRLALAPVAGADAVPPWLVLGLSIAVGPLARDGGITVQALIEDIGRQFLRWTGRWLDHGLEPVRTSWNRRCWRRGAVAELVLDGRRFSGPVEGLADDGAFLIAGDRLDLCHHLPSVA